MANNQDGVPSVSRNDQPGKTLPAAPTRRTVLGCGGCAWSVIGLLLLLLLLVLPAISPCIDAAQRCQCVGNLKMMGLAMHNYYQTYGCFPPAYIADAQGRPLHSWRVLILPFLEEEALYREIHLDEPWDSPHNREIFQKTPFLLEYRCPAAENPRHETCYVMIIGPNTISDGPHSIRMENIKDGASKTILITEVKDSGIPWYEPRDLNF